MGVTSDPYTSVHAIVRLNNEADVLCQVFAIHCLREGWDGNKKPLKKKVNLKAYHNYYAVFLMVLK